MSEQQAFRDAMSRLGAAVNIVTTDGPAGMAGFTASAVCSVTDSPPTLLVCLNRNASVWPVFQANGQLPPDTRRSLASSAAKHRWKSASPPPAGIAASPALRNSTARWSPLTAGWNRWCRSPPTTCCYAGCWKSHVMTIRTGWSGLTGVIMPFRAPSAGSPLSSTGDTYGQFLVSSLA